MTLKALVDVELPDGTALEAGDTLTVSLGAALDLLYLYPDTFARVYTLEVGGALTMEGQTE